MQDGFDRIIERAGTASLKWDGRGERFGREDVIPLWVADMDFLAPRCVRDALERRLAHGVFGYTRMPAGFAEAIASWLARRHGWQARPEWVVPCAGVVFGLYAAVRAFAAPGDGVVVQPPVYDPFYRAVESGGRTVVRSPLRPAGGSYEMDLAGLEACLAAGARMMLLCSPHNPGGRVWRRAELEAVLAAAARRDALVVCDEIHADMVFPGSRHVPIGSLPGAEERVITLSSPTKAFNFPALPVGYAVIADESLRSRFREELRRIPSPTPSIFAIDAVMAAYTEGEGWLEAALSYLDGNRAAVERFCAERLPGVRAMRPQASYLSWIDFRGLGLSENDLHERLVREAGVGLSRGSSYGQEGSGFMRLNFGCPRSLLDQALERIALALCGG